MCVTLDNSQGLTSLLSFCLFGFSSHCPQPSAGGANLSALMLALSSSPVSPPVILLFPISFANLECSALTVISGSLLIPPHDPISLVMISIFNQTLMLNPSCVWSLSLPLPVRLPYASQPMRSPPSRPQTGPRFLFDPWFHSHNSPIQRLSSASELKTQISQSLTKVLMGSPIFTPDTAPWAHCFLTHPPFSTLMPSMSPLQELGLCCFFCLEYLHSQDQVACPFICSKDNSDGLNGVSETSLNKWHLYFSSITFYPCNMRVIKSTLGRSHCLSLRSISQERCLEVLSAINKNSICLSTHCFLY